MRVWRVVVASFAANAFSGDGARLAGGRWNPKGVPVVYAASSLALATLELLVHVADDLMPAEWVSFALDLPDDLAIESLTVAQLPPDWREYPAPDALQMLGADWCYEQRSAVLAVPSAVIPVEFNYLINPKHPDFTRITWASPQPFQLDARLRK